MKQYLLILSLDLNNSRPISTTDKTKANSAATCTITTRKYHTSENFHKNQLKEIYTIDSFPIIFYNGDFFFHFLFAVVHTNPILKRGLL